MFYVLLRDQASRDGLIAYLKQRGIQAVFHYVPLHSSPMGSRCGRISSELSVTDDVSARLVRLSFFYEIGEDEQREVAKQLGACLRAQRGAA
jgi:dTDP-4-amino-4,6-dideoxygalactose transaminase